MGNTAAYRGGGFYVFSGTANLINNTITRNRCTISSSTATGGGVLVYSGATCTGKNNIVWDNSSYTNPNVGGTANFTYTDVQGGLSGTGNINADPLFVHNPPNGYSYLSQTAAGQSQNSPCMNAGDPASSMITGSTRTDMVQDAGIVDMGFHWQSTLVDAVRGLQMDDGFVPQPTGMSNQPETIELKAYNHPNPFNPTTTITLCMDQAASVDLTVYDASGKAVERLFQGTLEAGTHDFLFSGTSLPTGVYLYRASSAGKIATGKALLVK